ncbi:PREDICTED: sushi, von Willebrand factor type A, EGF and pentraxin domain-containing protein 1-like [Branchiostoma belcheri]|uniref:Sushi, von Willebrand factor type A, EGF and pentraxin domain-containing protein 1-like n=1 Tax=Branchiostoma belcheri TaxID=7741 RepID=A0A6P4ZVW4_BRABE|nr:PREDICTED: sushi, von Willebrand factor type A, EGF and pentraxin domain-containing protein 1-like [Branchiostoma belcheri]
MGLPSCILLLTGIIFSLSIPVHLKQNLQGDAFHGDEENVDDLDVQFDEDLNLLKDRNAFEIFKEVDPTLRRLSLLRQVFGDVPPNHVLRRDLSRKTRGIKPLLLGVLAWHILQNSKRPPPPKPDTTPPQLTHCPSVGDVVLSSGQTTACINLGQPTYKDDRSQTVRVIKNRNVPSNGCFPEGHYTISYIALDDSGNRNEDCQLRFSVKDVQPPKFINCPDDVIAYAERNKDHVIVTWPPLQARDNSGEEPIITQIDGPQNGSLLSTDGKKHRVLYTAMDNQDNRNNCSFSVIPQAITCEPLYINQPKLSISCTNGFNFGSTCKFACESGYPLVGMMNTSCELTGDNTPRGKWIPELKEKNPTCKVLKCPPLRLPKNGAISCSGWALGETCQLQCADRYDIPYNMPSNGLWVCSTTNGVWAPDDRVLDCTRRRNPRRLRLPGELYYYSGSCGDLGSLQEIRENFIKALNISAYSELCLKFTECTATNVNVTCGPVTRRARGVQAAAKYRVRIGFHLQITPSDESLLTQQDMYKLEETLDMMATTVEDEMREGRFNLDSVGDMALDLDVYSVYFDHPEMECPYGTVARYSSHSCASCSTGTFYDGTAQDCMECPRGQYQDQDGQLLCKSCPPDTSTVQTAATSALDCKGYCPPGKYSVTGLKPCSTCKVNTYQPEAGRTFCHPCPNETVTTYAGATSSKECYEPIPPDGCTDCGTGLDSTVQSDVADTDGCSEDMCQNNGTCVDGAVCQCPDGFSGDFCEAKQVLLVALGYKLVNVTVHVRPLVILGRTASAIRWRSVFARERSVQEPLLNYECGERTGYMWPHQNALNPDGKLPACGRVTLPRRISLHYEFRYPNLPCEAALVETFPAGPLPCVTEGRCKQAVTVTCNHDSSRTTPASVMLSVTADVPEALDQYLWQSDDIEDGELDTRLAAALDGFKPVLRGVEEVLSIVTSDKYVINVNGTVYRAEAEPGQPTTTVECPIGTVRLVVLCVTCPPGTLYNSGSCQECPLGSYQELQGQTQCQYCPAGQTTLGMGTVSEADCVSEP